MSNRISLYTRPFLLLLSLVCFSWPVKAQWVTEDAGPPPSSVNEILQRYSVEEGPGAAVAVIQNGEVVHQEAFGIANLEYNVPIENTTRFHVASLSKQFTAYAIMQLAESGMLSLADPVTQHLPELKHLPDALELRHLLHHTSGLKDDLGMLSLAGWRHDDLFTSDDVVNAFRGASELSFNPGERYAYSNTNYSLLARIVERVTSESFAAWTNSHIFEPIGMESSRFVDSPATIVPGKAAHYEIENDQLRHRPHTWFHVGAGGLFTTIKDFSAWALHLLSPQSGGESLLAKLSRQGTTNDGSEIDYAYGLVHGTMHSLPTIAHGGSGPGHHSSITLFPEQEFAVIVLSNGSGGALNAGQLASEIAEFYLADEISARTTEAAPRRAMVITTEDLAATPEGSYPANPEDYPHYAGTYRLENAEQFQDDLLLSRPLIVSEDNGRLLLAFGEPPGIPMAPIAEDRFRVMQLNFEVTFQRKGSGEPFGLIFHITEASFGNDPVQDLYAIKQQQQQLTPDMLDAYTGVYYSRELETTYRFSRREGGELEVFHPRHGLIPLQFLAPDEFLADTHIFTNVSFKRDDAGNIAGVRLRGFSWGSNVLLERTNIE